MLVRKFKHETVLRVMHIYDSLLYKNLHTWYEDLLCSASDHSLLIKSFEWRGSSINCISADNCWGVA